MELPKNGWFTPKVELPKHSWFMIRNPFFKWIWGSPYHNPIIFGNPHTITARVSPPNGIFHVAEFDDMEAIIRRLNGDMFLGKCSLVNPIPT